MKRFLILFILTAFLAIPAISMAQVVTGAGVVPTLTIQGNSINYSGTNQSSVMTTQNFAFTKGALFFNVSSAGNSGDGGDASKYQRFKAQVSFAGSASSTASGKTAIMSNVSMNLSGLMLSADNKKSAALGCGTVNGTLNLNDGSTDNNGNPDPTQNLSFTGSYKMNVALAGFVSDGQGGTNPTSGTATITILISGVGPLNLAPTPNFNNSSSIMTNQISPQPVVVNVTLGAIPFKIGQGGTVPVPAGTANVQGTWNANIVKSDYSENDAATLILTQNGTSLTGIMPGGGDKGPQSLTGSVVGKVVTLQFTDSSKGETNTFTGTLNADGTLSGTYKSSLGSAGTWGAAKSTPAGITGSWVISHTPSAGSSSGDNAGTLTLLLEQFGTTVLGVNEDTGGAVAGSISSTGSIVLKFKGDNTGTNTLTITGTLNTVGTGHGTYSNTNGDKGTWNATEN